MPLSVYEHAVVTLADGQTGLLCGGWNGTVWQSACYFYSPTSDAWTSAPSLNVARSWLGMALFKNRAYAFGGWNGSEYLSSVETLTPASGWQLLPFGM